MSSRTWYLAVVPAVAFALAASSYRYVDVYLPNSPSDPVSGSLGETVHLDQVATVEGVGNRLLADVPLTGVTRLPAEREPALPDGTAIDVVAVDVDWSAPPESPLAGCSLRMITQEGETYLPASSLALTVTDADPAITSYEHCVPEDTPGPSMAAGVDFGLSEDDRPARPESWSTTVHFIVPEGMTPERVEMIWQTPTYLEFTGLDSESTGSAGAEARSSRSSAGAMNTSAARK
ncbi:MAG: hypothetical protein GXX79_22110 [Actinomycetales bacterium]|nr:hypothetical protein [Actinomycetales bacterium]